MKNKTDVKIVVIKAGWVVVGLLPIPGQQQRDGFLKVEEACVVRRWGTKAGLGEIAKNGPTGTTALDPIDTIHIPVNSILFLIDCDQKKWRELCLTLNA